ncbi:MAG: TetR/AcrR family transcriptional regulator [Actinomycetota bacterium]|nr:TetR/AcrR family transcriptional regulator [Actinomycetota bacterium]HZY65025.1 TetR/AcrR family transcriptional regulator [Rubrobacteraceae bacterium]
MPTFTKTEREHIREQLLETGRELFPRYGLKKTSLEDLTRPAGIAKSSFYNFFDSKEALYLELLVEERHRLRGEISADSFKGAVDGREAVERFLRAVIREFESNPLTRRIVTHPEEWRSVVRRVSPEKLEENVSDSTQAVSYFIRQGQDAGLISAGDPEVMAGLIRSVVVLGLHKDDIGRDIYPAVLEMMIGLVVDGLARKEKG